MLVAVGGIRGAFLGVGLPRVVIADAAIDRLVEVRTILARFGSLLMNGPMGIPIKTGRRMISRRAEGTTLGF